MKTYSGRNFTDYREWQVAHKLVSEVFRISAAFTENSKVLIVPRMQSQALNVTDSIAESLLLEDSVNKKESLVKAKKNLINLKNVLILSQDQKFLSDSLYNYLIDYSEKVFDVIDELLNKL